MAQKFLCTFQKRREQSGIQKVKEVYLLDTVKTLRDSGYTYLPLKGDVEIKKDVVFLDEETSSKVVS